MGERAAWPWATRQRNERMRKRGLHRTMAETREFDAILQRAVDAGFSATVPRVVASSPYDNRRVAALRGPVAERIELIEAHEPK